MIINISNNPANPKFGNEGDARQIDVQACEFFENGAYKQIVIAGIITATDGDGKETGKDKIVANSNNGDFDYEVLKAVAVETCEFVNIANVVKAQGCENMTTTLVGLFDEQGLFN